MRVIAQKCLDELRGNLSLQGRKFRSVICPDILPRLSEKKCRVHISIPRDFLLVLKQKE